MGVFSCIGPGVKHTFVLVKKYKQYRIANKDDSNDIEDNDDKNDVGNDKEDEDYDDDDNDDEGDEDGSFHSSASTMTPEAVEPQKKKAAIKSTEPEYSTMSTMGPRWSK